MNHWMFWSRSFFDIAIFNLFVCNLDSRSNIVECLVCETNIWACAAVSCLFQVSPEIEAFLSSVTSLIQVGMAPNYQPYCWLVYHPNETILVPGFGTILFATFAALRLLGKDELSELQKLMGVSAEAEQVCAVIADGIPAAVTVSGHSQHC